VNETTKRRVVSDGNREERERKRERRERERGPSAIELSAGFGDRKDIAHVTVGAINSRYIPAIIGTFLPPLATTRDFFFPPSRRGRGPFKASPLTHTLCLRDGVCRILIERSVSGTTRHTDTSVLAHGRFPSLARWDERPN